MKDRELRLEDSNLSSLKEYMTTTLIKLAYRIVIDSSSTGSFEKNAWNASYDEFKLKSQVYNTEEKFKTFTEMRSHDGRANSLHYKSGFAIAGFIEQLKKQIPHLKNSLEQPVQFDTCQFELIESDITDRFAHRAAIIFITDIFTLVTIVGHRLLLAKGNQAENFSKASVETFLLETQPGLDIVSWQLITL